ncbi:MAG TPA: hypothetical protein PKI20_13540, partial [Verrucomicrobiota bacterium]|nr:hypothetical protein [Verrucomicrobiota bacterium]HQL78704.1 hypothetical protein [Verrucomicrobiota bacterium]
MIYYGTAMIFGLDQRGLSAPITNLPAGATVIKRVVRSRQPAKAYVRQGDTTAVWALGPDGANVKLLWVLASNRRPR